MRSQSVFFDLNRSDHVGPREGRNIFGPGIEGEARKTHNFENLKSVLDIPSYRQESSWHGWTDGRCTQERLDGVLTDRSTWENNRLEKRDHGVLDLVNKNFLRLKTLLTIEVTIDTSLSPCLVLGSWSSFKHLDLSLVLINTLQV